MENEKKLNQIKKDARAMIRKVENVSVNSDKEMVQATELLSQVKIRMRRIEEIRIGYTKPLNESLRKINADFKSALVPYAEMEEKIKVAIIQYRFELEKKRQAMEAKLQEQARQLAIAEAKKNKKSAKKALENVIMPTIEKQENIIESKSGKVKTRKVKKFRIVDEKKVPKKYWIIDEGAIRQDVMAGVKTIKGVEIYEEELLSVY